MEYNIINSEIEGQFPIRIVKPIRLLKIRILIAVILSLITGFIIALILKWSTRAFLMLFIDADDETATHYLIDNQYICQRKVIKNTSTFRYKLLQYMRMGKEFRSVEYPNGENLYDDCELRIPIIPIYTYLFHELTGPFYILQYLSVVLWIIEGFILFSIVMLSFSLLACLINYALLTYSRVKLQRLASIIQIVKLCDFSTLDGRRLLPGMQFILERGQIMNCDCQLLEGDILMNEATLTGESVPVPKQTGSTLYEGTQIMHGQGIALVIRTGFSSQRGQYFRNVLFPMPQSRWFYIQAFKFLCTLAIIVISSFLISLIRLTQNFTPYLNIIRFFDALTWIIPPALPIFFSFAQTSGLIKLARKSIMGSDPAKTEIAGKIDTICFDKTGTLTTLQLTMREIVPDAQLTFQIMASCHHLREIDGVLQGDQLELEMFKYTNFQIEFGEVIKVSNGSQIIQVHKVFDFSSELPIMSVIVQYDGKFYLWSKGSPEHLRQSCVNPTAYQSQQNQWTKDGFRVIGLASKEIKSWDLPRSELEQNMTFVGLFKMENSLKSDTYSVIQELANVHLDLRVISGDNPYTCRYCAIQVGLACDTVIDYDFKSESIICENQLNLEQVLDQYQSIAITGNLWKYIQDQLSSQGPVQTSKGFIDDNDIVPQQTFMKLMEKVTVFARMKPHQKKEIVQRLQGMNRKVLMIGDGANDCSAIAQADVGVSFSQTDASYTAPFSSQSDSIKCVSLIIAQGRCTISIIIEIFQYYITVSVLKFCSALIMGYQGLNFTDFQFIYINYMSSIPLLVFLTLSSPLNELSNNIPLDDMFTFQNQIAIYTLIFIPLIGEIIIASIIGGGYVAQDATSYAHSGPLNSALLYCCLIYFMTNGITIYIGYPFKLRIWRNYPLSIWILACLIIGIVVTITGATWLDAIRIEDRVATLIVILLCALIADLVRRIQIKYFPVMRTLL